MKQKPFINKEEIKIKVMGEKEHIAKEEIKIKVKSPK